MELFLKKFLRLKGSPDYIKNKLSCDVPYQQLVTDGEGNVKWEDRLAYDNTKTEFIVDKL